LPKNLDSELNYLWTLRAGLFYDEEPASGRTDHTVTTKGDGEADPFYGFTLGLGLLVHQRANFDIAYQLRKGDGVNVDLVQGILGFEEDVIQHRVLLSAVIYFN
jgi:long-subunit fatty acid transport protein